MASICCHNCYMFICAGSCSVLKIQFSCVHLPTPALIVMPTFSTMMPIPSKERGCDVAFPFRSHQSAASFALHFGQLCISVLMTIY